jgi:general L-amino acid transport system permease protein|tara:strand:+ start:1421 stop:3319 length:1899 start_codon:yes stop_codon:yes gene_type:complete
MELKAPTLNDLKGLVLTALAVVLLWNYILFFLEPATEMVIQIARSIKLPSGLQSNETYYPLETTVKYIGGIMLIAFILVQNEVKNVLNPGAFFNLLIDTVRSPADAAGNWRDAYRSAVARIADWESYITTLVGIVVFYIILLWSASADLSPRSQIPFLMIGGSILTGFLLLQNELKTLIITIVKTARNPGEAVDIWKKAWKSVITTIVAIGIFLFIFLNAVFLPDLTQNFPTVLSAAMLVMILVWWKLMAMEMAKPAVAAKRAAAMAFLLAIPLILYLALRLMVLLKTDQSWDITLEFMQAKAGFNISNWPGQIDIANATRWEFYRAGIVNAVRAVLASMLLCTILGFIVGVTRLSSNKLASGLATVYVEIFRNFPFAVLLFVISSVMGQSLPQFREEVDIMDIIFVSNQGIWVPVVQLSNFTWAIAVLIGTWLYTRYEDWNGIDDSEKGVRRRIILWFLAIVVAVAVAVSSGIDYPSYLKPSDQPGSWRMEGGFEISPAFIAIVAGLTLYTSSHVAEIVRGSIQSLPYGQVEAAIALGLNPVQRLRLVIIPQALRSMIPSLNNQYMNVWKNSSLALIVAYNDFFYVNLVIVNKVGKAVPSFLLLLVTYQVGSLLISSIMNFYNSRVTQVKI